MEAGASKTDRPGIKKSQLIPQSKWAQSIAVGDESFVDKIKQQLRFRSKGTAKTRNRPNFLLFSRIINNMLRRDPIHKGSLTQNLSKGLSGSIA